MVIVLTKEREIEYPCVVCGSPFIMATGVDTNNDDSYICKCPKCGAVCSVAQDDSHAPGNATEEEQEKEHVLDLSIHVKEEESMVENGEEVPV